MRIIGLLKLRNGKARTLGEPWLDEKGNQLCATVETVQLNAEEWFKQTGERLTVPPNLKDGLAIILTGIDYIPETEVEIYDRKGNLEETQKTPAFYRLFGFIPFFNERNQMVGGVPHRDVDVIWASDVESYREAWDIKSVFLACRSLTEGYQEEEDDEDEDEEEEETRAENGQQPAQTT